MNRYGRPTNDPKLSTIKVRVNEEMRNYLEIQSSNRDISMSEYIRFVIEKDMSRK